MHVYAVWLRVLLEPSDSHELELELRAQYPGCQPEVGRGKPLAGNRLKDRSRVSLLAVSSVDAHRMVASALIHRIDAYAEKS
jgi:hypothetical protein